jgi:hypothetical protein
MRVVRPLGRIGANREFRRNYRTKSSNNSILVLSTLIASAFIINHNIDSFEFYESHKHRAGVIARNTSSYIDIDNISC